VSSIPWEKLQGDKRKTFEEFCYQIAKGLYGHQGRFTSIDDSGGGDGVEFYLTFPNGDIWGWQAKFFFPEGRLTISNRRTQIKKSLQRAYDVRGNNLKKWILCTPLNLTPNDQNWFDDKLTTSKYNSRLVLPKNHGVQLDNWGESGFNDWRREPRFNGINRFFFGELELALDWFAHQVQRQMQGVSHKFEAELHTETAVDVTIHRLLGDENAHEEFKQRCDELKNILDHYQNALAEIKSNRTIEWTGEGEKLLKIADRLANEFTSTLVQLEAILTSISNVREIDWHELINPAKKLAGAFQEKHATLNWDALPHIGNEDYEKENRAEVVSSTKRLDTVSLTFISDFERLEIYTKSLNQSDIHILGTAGQGKTHLVCNVCTERLNEELPALFALGKHFTGQSPLHSQLLEVFDIPRSYSWQDFLQTLDVVASVYQTRIPIIIDGLNDAIRDGRLSDVWEKGLAGLIADFASLQNVVLITTCRTSYKDAIWPDNDSQNRYYLHGFYGQELETLVSKYFQAYKIQADVTSASIEQFSHPIYLKIFCETKNSSRRDEKHVYVGEQSLFEIFDEYLQLCNQAICDRLGYRSRTSVVIPALSHIANYLWQNQAKQIPVSTAVELIDDIPLEKMRPGQWDMSKCRALENEGLLICRDWGDSEEVYFFTYDLLGGYLIARQIIHDNNADIQSFLNNPRTIQVLYNESYADLHPLAEDIRRCIAALLPTQTKGYLHDIVDNPQAFSDSVYTLFEISPNAIDESCLQLLERLFEKEPNRSRLLELSSATVAHIHHPLNINFWHKILLALSMPERDTSWSEYIRQSEEIEEKISYFESLCKKNEFSTPNAEQRLHLFAQYFMWTLTTSARPIRDRATRALYWYGRQFPSRFFELVLESFAINDPYIPERMLAAAYGISMALHVDFHQPNFVYQELKQWGRVLYDAMFKPDAKHSTTHFLARDYAWQIINLSVLYNPELLSENEIEYITQPFRVGGIRDWGESEELEKGSYNSDGPGPLMMDFENYTLGGLVKDRRNYDNDHPEYKKVVGNIYWRIYQLGYSRERFGEIDLWIDRANQRLLLTRNDDRDKTERYGKKYSWIAYFELLGYLYDNGKLDLTDFGGRDYDTDIDPSFPDDPPDYPLITEDFLGDKNVSTQDWIESGGVPDIGKYLVAKNMADHDGNWTLLDGYINQEDADRDRNRFTFIRTLLVRNQDIPEIIHRLKKQNMGNRWLPEIPERCGFLYAGEIPWSKTFPENEWEELEFVIGTEIKQIPEEKIVFLRDNIPISEEEEAEFLEEISAIIAEKDEEAFVSAIEEHGLKAVVQPIQRQESVDLIKKYKTLIPVHEFTRHYYHTLKSGGSCTILAKQLSEKLNLIGQPQSFDLFNRDGRRATFAIQSGYGSEATKSNRQHFLYIRKDLLDLFLTQEDLNLVWVIWGERQFSIKTMANRAPAYRGRGKKPWKVFQSVIAYDDVSSGAV